MTPVTVKFVEETDDAWIYEGLAIPYGGPVKGQDLTGSHFTKDSDLCLDWFPDGGRPLLYRHGFDATLKASPIGRETGAVREDDKGRWYRLQIDKAKEYAAEVRQLADDGMLSLSTGAVDHLASIAAKSGAIIRWPWVELSFVPNPANPEALLYQVKSIDAVEHLRIVGTATPPAVRGWLPDETTEGDLDDGDFAWLADDTKLPDSTRRKLPYKVHGEVSDAGWRAAWSRVHAMAPGDFSGGPTKAKVIRKLLADKPAAVDVVEAPAKSSDAAWDASSATYALGNLISLLGEESDEPDQADLLRVAIDAVSKFLTAEVGEIGTPVDAAETVAEMLEGGADMPPTGFLSVREGKRNSISDMASIQSIHDATRDLGAACGATAERSAPDGAARLVITGSAATKEEPDLTALTAEMTVLATAKAREILGLPTG
jgi:hypothetical protein